MSRFQPKHIVAMVVAVCAAAVLAPVSVMAATGTLTNIADATDPARLTKVFQSGELAVGSRASSLAAGNITGSTTSTSKLVLTTLNAPSRIALTQLALATYNATASGAGVRVLIFDAVRQSGTGTCSGYAAGTTAGFLTHAGRVVVVPVNDTLALSWDGPAWTLPKASTAGNPTCLFAQVQAAPAGTTLYITGTYYTFTD